MALGNVAYAAPVASTPATLGVFMPTTTVPGTANAAIGTGFTPVPSVIGGGGTTPTSAQNNNAAAAMFAPAANAAAAENITALGATPGPMPSNIATATNATNTVNAELGGNMGNQLTAAAVGGGPISAALENGVARIAAFAQNGITNIQNAIEGDMAANNGKVDPAKMQQYTMQMSTFEMIMQLAAKIQEKQERSTQIWLQL